MVISALSNILERQTAVQYKDENNSPTLLAIHGTFCGAAVLAVILRLYVKAFMLKSVGADDWVMVAAAVSGALQPEQS
jgi:hypothetical protein